MAMINPEGLYFGDRMARLSLMARLHWPYLFLLSNGYGRFEISYPKIVSKAYATFPAIPTPDELSGFIREYAGAYLLFVYRSNGQVWGQWDTSEKFLPNYKDAEARNSPQPPQNEVNAWREGYIASKVTEADVSINLSNLFENVCGNFCENPKGLEKGLEKGLVKNLSSPQGGEGAKLLLLDASLRNPEPESESVRTAAESGQPRKLTKSDLELRQEIWFEKEFWPTIWRKVDKADALKSFKKKATSEAVKEKIVNAAILQGPTYLARDLEHRPHAATWLNKNRFDDEVAVDRRITPTYVPAKEYDTDADLREFEEDERRRARERAAKVSA